MDTTAFHRTTELDVFLITHDELSTAATVDKDG